MKFDAGEIGELVKETKRERSNWTKAAEEWEEMWALHRYDQTRGEAKELDQVEAVVTSDPYNIVQLVSRFVANQMRVEIPYLTDTEEDDERSVRIEEWLSSFWNRCGKQQGRNIIEDMTWYSAVRGRGAMQVIWIQGALENMGLADRRMPMLARTLDPFNVGVERGPYWTEWAYHEFDEKESFIRQQFPKFKFPEKKYSWQRSKKKYKVIDFYWMDKGSVWHAVTVDGQFAKNPVKTDTPEIPIIEWYADGAPIDDELMKSLSILHPIRDLWRLKCDLASAIGTGLLYYFDPVVKAIGFNQDIEIEPGAVIKLPNPNMDIDFVRGEPNVPMAEKMLNLVQSSIDQSTFPAVLYGEQPGGVQAGFAINSLAQQARNRVNTIRSNLEGALEQANELIMAQIEVFDDDGKGVQIWGRSMQEERSRPLKLAKKDIGGNYANEVTLIPEIPTDENGRIQIWLQMVKEGIVSKATMRTRAINLPLPRDEETRIAVERAEVSQELLMKSNLRALQRRFRRKPDTLKLLTLGTPFEQMLTQEEQWQEQKAEEARLKREENKRLKQEEEMMRLMAEQGPMMPGGPPGAMSMGPGVPPPPMGGMPGGPGLPPGMDPMMAAPPPMPPGPPPTDMQPPGLMGVPPQAAGQFTRDMMGVDPMSPAGAFDMATGNYPSDEEMLGQFEPPMV